MHTFHFIIKMPGDTWAKKEIITEFEKNLRVIKRKKDSQQRQYIFEDIIWGIDIHKGYKFFRDKLNRKETRVDIP